MFDVTLLSDTTEGGIRKVSFQTDGVVCSKQIDIELEGDTLRSVRYTGGCHGNICRSPMAEFIFKALVKARGLDGRYRVASAAVSAEEIGNPIYPPAKRCLSQHGVAFDPDKRARQVSH